MFNFMTPVKQMHKGLYFIFAKMTLTISGFRGEDLNVIFYQNMSIKMGYIL
jgi:hypothetical protein